MLDLLFSKVCSRPSVAQKGAESPKGDPLWSAHTFDLPPQLTPRAPRRACCGAGAESACLDVKVWDPKARVVSSRSFLIFLNDEPRTFLGLSYFH